MKQNKIRVKPLEIQAYIKGKCFICNLPTEDKTAYAHYQCCRAMCEHKDSLLKQIAKQEDEHGSRT